MKASVIIPAYNAEKNIGNCLASLREQRFSDFEIIVVDDGSRDGTAKVVKGFKGVRLLQQSNAGPARARNLGVEKAKGEVVVFIDSDCVATPGWLEGMLKPFQDSKVAGVQGRYKTRQKSLVARFIHLEIEKRYEKMMKKQEIDFIGSYAAAYKKSVFQEMGGFDTSFPMASGEDTDLSFRIHKARHKMVFNSKAIVFHTHPESLWKYLKVKFFRAFWRMKIYRKHKSKVVKDTYTPQRVKLQTGLLYLAAIAVIASPFAKGAMELAAALFLLLVLSTLPFAAWAFSRDKAVGVVAPVVVVLRTVMFSFGMAAGILRNLVR